MRLKRLRWLVACKSFNVALSVSRVLIVVSAAELLPGER
jgi:hypothetical protein